MIVYGVILVLGGLADIVIPDQMAKLMGLGEIVSYAKSLIALLGAIWVAAGAWVIVAGRDPLRHVSWVKFSITELSLLVVVGLYSIIRSYVEFSQGGPLLIVAAVLAAALLAFYPWRAARGTQQVSTDNP